MSPAQNTWKWAGALLLVCGLQSYGQPVDPRAMAAAKFAAARESLTSTATQFAGPVAAGAFVTFDVPGAVNGTFPDAINNGGVITGYYSDNTGSGFHGFLRSQNGDLITFDVPGALFGTFPTAINPAGTIAGVYFVDTNFVGQGFLRASNGAFTTFDAPGGSLGFLSMDINPSGQVTGTYFDVSFVLHGFLRDDKGTLITIDVPGAVNGTNPVSIAPDGTILGSSCDASNNCHGFLRDQHGAFTTFDPPSPGPIGFGGFQGQPGLSINPQGTIAGNYFQPIAGNPFGGNYRGFLRSPEGAYTTFDAASYPPCCIWTFSNGITPAENVTGSYNDGLNVNHGFLRARDGTIFLLDVPAAGTGALQGTLPWGITPAGVVFGQYIDAKLATHGFTFQPR
jgi:hypothetical protein